MCGFLNIFSNKQINEPLKIKMAEAKEFIKQRGPDDQGTVEHDGAFMQFARLSIVDLTEAGHQPMVSSCGRYFMTFNGEIYNFRELVSTYQLKGLKGHSDSEALLELYVKLGKNVVDVIRGMYAFIIYDKVNKTFFGARDMFGIKPLYFSKMPDAIIFSSEIKAILSVAGNTNINERAVRRYLLQGVMDDEQETFFSNIFQVPAGHIIEGNCGSFVIKKSKELSLMPTDIDQKEYQENYRSLLLDKMDQYLYSDVPIGVSLSGGFDSSFLAYLIYARARGQKLHMFSRGYEKYDESELQAARNIGKKFNFEYHEAVLSAYEVPSLLEQCSRIQEHPITSISILAFHKKYQMARGVGLKVLLEGHGGDEIWAGYEYYINAFNKKIFDQEAFSQDGSSLNINREIINDQARESFDFLKVPIREWSNLSYLTQMQLKDMFGGKLQRSLRYVDRASMHEGIEVRLPFLDEDVVVDALRIPDSWKVHDGHYRYFARTVALPFLGESVAFRPKVPIQDPQRLWLQTQLREYVHDVFHSNNLFISRMVDVKKLRVHFERFINDPDQYKNLTFIMFPLFLEIWHRSMKEFLVDKGSIAESICAL